MQVAANGDLANWMVPGSVVKGVGGAMDLVSGAGRVIVLMDHVAKSGVAKLVASCDLPVTGRAVVDRVITDPGVFDVTGDGFAIVELAWASTSMRWWPTPQPVSPSRVRHV